MKTYTFTLTQIGKVVTLNAVVIDDQNDGNSVPCFGDAAFQVFAAVMSEVATGVQAGELQVARGVVNGVIVSDRNFGKPAAPPRIVVPS